MFLKSLTLRGFKSFADKTTLDFEPGITVVVGPNGSGKSNVVDAVAWVLGAQGARALRGGKMDDVIFAGTAGRPPLGRAEVSLTIDNASGLLPIEFSEVTITRTLFRTGESEYQMNGAPCRLLDIQELLSDTGIGRQQHVIVGQGQLDAVLNARPEDRRGVIEEAAGILKFRKRKEKAERRLDATEGNVLRLTDLLREVRRQLRPLERQADAARRHDGLVDELRGVRVHLAGRELDALQSRLDRRRASRSDLARVESEVRARLRELDTGVLGAERALSVPGDDDVADLLGRAESLRERARGLRALVGEKLRGLDRELASVADEGVVESLVADAATLRVELAAVDAEARTLLPERVDADAAEQAAAVARRALEDDQGPTGGPEMRERRAAEDVVREAEAAWRDAESEARAHGARTDALASDAPAARSGLASVDATLATLGPDREAARTAEREVQQRRDELEAADISGSEASPEAIEVDAAEVAARSADEAWRTSEREASRWRARAETLALALAEAQASAGGESLAGLAGVAGPLLDGLEIDAGAEAAVAAALGDAMQAVVVDGGAAARAAVQRVKDGDAQALLVIADSSERAHVQGMLLPPGSTPLYDRVRSSSPALDSALRRLLANVALVESGWRAALDLALEDPAVVAVTPEGDRFGGLTAWRAGPPGRSAVTPAALAEATEEAERAEIARSAAEAEVDAARSRLEAARSAEQARADAERERRSEIDRAQAEAARHRHDVEMRVAALEERRAGLVGRLAGIEESLAGAPEHGAALGETLTVARMALDEARERLDVARRADVAAAERLRERREEVERMLAAAATSRRDVDVRSSGIEQRRGVLARRLTEVEGRLAARPDEEAAAQERRAAVTHRREATEALDKLLEVRSGEIESVAERLRRRRREQSEAAREAGVRLDALRTERAAAERELSENRERASRLEIEEAETRLRIETAVEALRRDFDCEPQVAVAAPPPDVPEGITLAGRARELDRELRLLGPINPLALSEYEALQERHEFLQTQLDDVKESRRELHRLVRAVDAEIVNLFEVAFADVAVHFEQLFATLFPGGGGRITLTDPSDMLNTGVEIEARPSGKNLRRLSLLSGGERSLTALAYLFAVFRARPSPFYLMDEVEAALDDVNLHRFLDLVHEFRGEAQLVVVSHQKRTMEAADVLYGISMPPGGSSRVVSQRIRDLQLEEA